MATDTLHAVRDKVVEAAHAGVEKTQEVYNEYVAPNAQAGKRSPTCVLTLDINHHLFFFT